MNITEFKNGISIGGIGVWYDPQTEVINLNCHMEGFNHLVVNDKIKLSGEPSVNRHPKLFKFFNSMLELYGKPNHNTKNNQEQQ